MTVISQWIALISGVFTFMHFYHSSECLFRSSSYQPVSLFPLWQIIAFLTGVIVFILAQQFRWSFVGFRLT